MNYLFGPVKSRRLGLSQGIDLIPAKICNFNCIYCEVGATTLLTCERKEYVPTAAVLAEIDELLSLDPELRRLDVFTITGSGEPTLHSGIGRVIRYLKGQTDKPVAVLTNGSLLYLDEVRADLLAADIVIPSLDAARPASYRKINRPASCVELEEIIEGLSIFSREFAGEFWLEVLLVSGVNDWPEDIVALQQAISRIKPARIQLNSVARPPLEKFAVPLSRERMSEIAGLLAENFIGPVDILVEKEEDRSRQKTDLPGRSAGPEAILEMLQRRPCTAAEISETLQLDPEALGRILAELERTGRIARKNHNGRGFFLAKDLV